MKILKKAEANTWKHVFTCEKCESELEAEAIDVIHVHHAGDMRDPSYDSYHVTCAVCDHKHDLMTNKLPKVVQLEAKKRSSNAPAYL
jgi:transcription elongation factor Elf1